MTRKLVRNPVEAHCTECGDPVTLTEKMKVDAYRQSGRTYCRPDCRDTWVNRDRSARMARTNRKHASARMKANNPMARPEVREKMSATLKGIKHKPRSQGGNGKAAPEPQAKLAEFLGWPMEVVVAPKDQERPFHYKLDIAHPSMKVCVEVDGGSHLGLARQASDRRRDERLAKLGWLTFRFSNREAMERTAECARTVLSTTSKWQARTPT